MHYLKNIILFSFLFSFLFSCRPDSQSSAQQFEEYKTSDSTVVSTKKGVLAVADRLGIDYKIEQASLVLNPQYRNDLGEAEKIINTISFPNITEKQLTQLKNAYGNHSRVRFQEGADYHLSDVLPPFIQATEGKRFLAHQLEIPQQIQEQVKTVVRNERPEIKNISFAAGDWKNAGDNSYVLQNCTGAAIEVARSSQQDIVVFSPVEPRKFFSDERYFETVIKTKGSLRDFFKTHQSILKTYDLVTINSLENNFDSNDFDHTMVFIDNGIIFEKTNPDSNAPYKFTLMQNIPNTKEEITVFRKKTSLPNPQAIFSMGSRFASAKSFPDLLGYSLFLRLVDEVRGSSAFLYRFFISPFAYDEIGRASPSSSSFQFESIGGKKNW